MFAAPVVVAIDQLHFSVVRKEQGEGIHFCKNAADIGFGVVLLPVAMRDEVVEEVFLGGVAALAVQRAAAEVIGEIADDAFGGYVHEFAQQQELVGEGEFEFGIAVVVAGLPFHGGFFFGGFGLGLFACFGLFHEGCVEG